MPPFIDIPPWADRTPPL